MQAMPWSVRVAVSSFLVQKISQSERSIQSCWPLTQGKRGSTHHPLGRSKLDACQYDGGNNWEDLCSQMALVFSIHHSNIAAFSGLRVRLSTALSSRLSSHTRREAGMLPAPLRGPSQC